MKNPSLPISSETRLTTGARRRWRLSSLLLAGSASALLTIAASAEPPTTYRPTWSRAAKFIETRPLREIQPDPLTPQQLAKYEANRSVREKNEENTARVKPAQLLSKILPFTDPALQTFKNPAGSVSPPIANFDGPDMDAVSALFAGGRFAPPDTNGAVGPNHFVITTNGCVQIFNKTGVAAGPAVRISTLLAGIANATDDDGDPIVLYDALADRWIISQFNLQVTAGSTHEHVAVSKTGDPTGAYYAYDFLLTANRPGDYPHMGVWPDGYYFSTNDFSLPVFSGPFQGAGLYALDRVKMLAGDPSATIIGFNTSNLHGGMLPSNFQGFTPPPAGTPNLFFEFDADEFGAATDLIRPFIFHADFAVPANSTLVQGTDIPTLPFDARQPNSRSVMQQPAPGEGLDAIADRLMHALNFRVLPGGVQSYVLNFTVNVSGVNPIDSATYQGGVRWMELRRDASTGAITINQEATYAPGAPNPLGRDVWMASIAQDHEGNIALAANATNSGLTPPALAAVPLNPTAIYTGRLPGSPPGVFTQGEVDVLAAASVTGGVQIATSNRWGDYSSLFVDPSDDCTFWGAFEYVDAPTASFDWNTRVFSFKVNPNCSTPFLTTINGTITNCVTGLPIQGALVTTPEGFARTTDALGTYSMTVPPGTYTVTASGPPGAGFDTCSVVVNTGGQGGPGPGSCCLTPSPIIVSAGASLVAENCLPANGSLDPGETVTVAFCVQNTGSANTTNLVGTLQNAGGVTGVSGPQNYGVVVAGGPAVCRTFTFTVDALCGDTITASLQLQDGDNNLGTLTYSFTIGQENVTLAENFDGVTAPALPAGWVATQGINVTKAPLWVTSTTTPDTAPNHTFSTDPDNILDNYLETPSIAVTTSNAQLKFRNNFDTESTYDGGVLEVSSPNINGGAYTDITDAAVGGSFVTGGYNATISTDFGSPIAGRDAWSGDSGGYIDTVANLGPNVVGQNIKLRFRMASDNGVNATGWRVDTVRIVQGFVCCTGLPSPSPSPSPSPTAAPVENDLCPGAIPIACGQTISGNTTLATIDDVPACNTTLNTAPGVWYTFTGDGLVNTLSTCGFVGYDTKLGVFTGSCGALTCVTGIDDFCGLQSQVTFPTTVGTTYFVLVTGFSTASGPFTLSRTCAPPPAQLINLSTRMRILTGDAVGIGGFIITGEAPKRVIVRAIGPSLSRFGLEGFLLDPVLELHGPGSFMTITNDNWQDTDRDAIAATGIPPIHNLESAIVATLAPGAYTAVVSGRNGTVGLGLVEIYDLDPSSASQLANISTRAFGDTGSNLMIAGFILGNNTGNDDIVVRGLGPTLTESGVTNTLADPSIELRNGDGALLASNNDWQDVAAQATIISGVGLAPHNTTEAAIYASLPPGLYTVLLTDQNGGVGNGLVEVYQIGLPAGGGERALPNK